MTRDLILIADDEPDIALILKLQLEDAGYATKRARDGVEALEALSRESFALILLDIKMPRMDGLEVLERIRRDYGETAVIMMTAHGNEDIAVEAMKQGAIDYIAKPFSTDDLLKRVERAINYNRTRLENERLQRQVADERRKLEAVLQGMADMLVAIDWSGRVILLNRAAEQMLGIAGDQAAGMPVTQLLQADIPSESLPCMNVVRSGAPSLGVSYTLRKKGGELPVLSSAAPLFNSLGELAGSVEIIRDISRLKALEQEKEDFVSMLSHDLKTPITAVVGSIDLVREKRLGPINPDQKEYLDSAVESCAEMVEMIDTLLDVHKFEAGKMALQLRSEHLPALIARVMAKFEPEAARVEIGLSSSCASDLPEIKLDRQKFTRLLGNLLSNALKFTPAGGEIVVSADLTGEDLAGQPVPDTLYPPESRTVASRYLRLQVRDTGAGIPAESLSAIFDRFEQARNRRMGKTRGTGLGLAFCRKVMDQHQGYIWAESEIGRGSCFTVLFPLAD